MEELKRFQGFTFDTIARKKLVEDRDTILELTGKIQELQNEVTCMNDSRVFNDAESVRSGLSHVTSQPAFFPPFQNPGGTLSRSIGMPCRRDGPPSIWDTHGISGNVFCRSNGVFFSTLSAGIESMLFRKSRIDSLINSGEEWKSNTNSRSEMPVKTVSQRFSHLQWRRLFKELWSRPTTTADFRSSFWQVPRASNVPLLEDKIQAWGMCLFTVSYGSYAEDQRSGVGWFIGLIQIFVLCNRNPNAQFWSTRCEDRFSTEPNHP